MQCGMCQGGAGLLGQNGQQLGRFFDGGLAALTTKHPLTMLR